MSGRACANANRLGCHKAVQHFSKLADFSADNFRGKSSNDWQDKAIDSLGTFVKCWLIIMRSLSRLDEPGGRRN